MDGTLATLFLVAGLTDMTMNFCDDGCLATSAQTGRIAVSAGDVEFQGNRIGNEIYLRYDVPKSFGPFQPALGISVTDEGSIWFGAGSSWTYSFAQNRGYVQLHLMPGVYSKGDGPDLGSTIEFRSGAEIGFETAKGVRIGLSYDHRSNADTGRINPGLETIQLRASFPLR
jgi:hypothetical protein